MRLARRNCSWCGQRVRKHYSPFYKCGACRNYCGRVRKAGYILSCGLFVAGMGVSVVAPAHAASKRDVFNCRQVAQIVERVATARDQGVLAVEEASTLEKNHFFGTLNAAPKQAQKAVAEAVVGDVYSDNSGKDPEGFYNDVYDRCVNRGVEE
jgi:hypothetical protein